MTKESKAQYKVEVFTGIRPTGNLTIANYIGAVVPLLDLQSQGRDTMVFVADMHGLTDKEPNDLQQLEVVADYIALGLDPAKVTIFVQSDIAPQVSELTMYLMRLISIAELIRIPTLKEKLKEGADERTANALLAAYPVMMATDILLQRSEYVPIGEDQVPHMEVTRLLAQRFNKRYSNVFPIPKTQEVKPLRILSLKGTGKMSKTSPEGAIFLTDAPEDAKRKIMRAETAAPGEMTPNLESLFTISRALAIEDEATQLDNFIKQHQTGEKILGEYKKLLAAQVERFLIDFQSKRSSITPEVTQRIVGDGAMIARENASETVKMVKEAMGF
jgi:tryptophanyl-tRNA synthetase